jgi:hypothetical protein
MDRHEGQNRYPNRVHSNGYNTYNDQYTSRVVDNSAQRVDKEIIFTIMSVGRVCFPKAITSI